MAYNRTLEKLNFDNTYRQLPDTWYQLREPEPLKNVHLISFNPRVAALLDLDPCQTHPDGLVKYFSGMEPLPGAEPLAMKYTGHQFGHYNPDLGDGRGLLLGEVVNSKGQRWDLHLKGAGRTAFSRFGDGRAVLRSSIREYLVSEAMTGLGIPSTQALCLLGSEEYTRRIGMEPCALVVRVTPCHIRFGHFEYFYYSNRHDDLKRLADYCLGRFYPSLLSHENPYLEMFKEIANRTARLVAWWQAYGFVHGVLNTDNMSIIGETFDYGPFTFLDNYEPDHIANKNDDAGRYAFFRQPAVVLWNMACLAQALLPLVEREALEAELAVFSEQQARFELERKCARLGLLKSKFEDADLIAELWDLFKKDRVDIHRFFSDLVDIPLVDLLSVTDIANYFPTKAPVFLQWLEKYYRRASLEAASPAIRRAQMRSVNPYYILRNYMAEEAIREAEQGDYRKVNELMPLLRCPSDLRPDMTSFTQAPPEWAAAICLTCSS